MIIHYSVFCLESHLKSAKGNALYTSKVIQNELITICGNIVRDEILKDIRNARFFQSLLMRLLIQQM